MLPSMKKLVTCEFLLARFACRHPSVSVRHFVFVLATATLLAPQNASALDPALDVSQYGHTAWKVRDGFARSGIWAIAQTPDGYLWLGTETGLVRFDGVRAAPWQAPDGAQLPSGFVTVLLARRDGSLWIGTKRGLASWQSGKLKRHPELGESVIQALFEDREGTLWIGGAGISEGDLCAEKDGRIRCFGEVSSETPVNDVNAIYEDRRGDLWVTSSTDIWRWKPGPSEHYPLPRELTPVYGLIESDTNTILLSTRKGLEEFVDGRIKSYPLVGVVGQFRPVNLFRSSDGSLWVSTWQGLLHLHQGRADVFKAIDGLSADFVVPILEDREGTVWVGTPDGLDRFRDVAAPVISRNQGLATTPPWSLVATPDGSVWIGTADGLNRWTNGHFTFYRSQKSLGESDRLTGRPREIASSGLSGVAQSVGNDPRGRLWASTSEGVFYRENDRFVRVSGLPGGYTEFIAGDREGNVWISNRKAGLYRLTRELIVRQFSWAQFKHKFATALLPDESPGGLWLGFEDGGIAHFKDGKVYASYSAADGLGTGFVGGLRLGSDGGLWAATEGGLSRIEAGHITTLDSKNGLPCDSVHWSIEDDDRSTWLSMPCGLVRVARSELNTWVNNPKYAVQTTVFDVADGVRTPAPAVANGYTPSVTRAGDGRIWFLSRDGSSVSFIDPHRLPINNVPPPVYVERIIADRKMYDVSSRVRLPALIRELQIDYTALSLVASENNRFRVMLEGWDRDWQDVGTRRQVFYSNLPPRAYRFRITARNNSGVWNEAGAAVDLVIPPAYYQTMWFLVLSGSMVLALFWAIHRLRLRIVEKHGREITALNERLMKAQEQERIRISGELHDGVMQQISVATLMLATVKGQVAPDSEAREAVRDVQQRLMQVGTDIRQLSHNLHPPVLEESGLTEAAADFCEEFRRLRGIEVSLEAEENVRELSRATSLGLFRILQEALANVAKHAAATHVTVRLVRSSGNVALTVADNGAGFVPGRSRASGGLGLISMRERAHQMNGTFDFTSEPGRGTTISVVIPFR
jgi:signal transduction histidine kinase/ligand-binding sensor domain-containing protein